MMTAYSSIYDGIPYVTAVLMGIALLSLVFQKNSLIARSILHAFGFWLAPLFYLTYIVLLHRISLEILEAFFTECAILGSYYALFSSLLFIVTNKDLLNLHQLMHWLKVGTMIIVAFGLQLVFSGNFGIFSEGSRNQYIADSRWFLYSTYASSIVQTLMIPIVASILNHKRKWDKLVIVYLGIVLVLSVLIGSKGGGVLSIFAILSLLKFPKLADYIKLLWLPFIVIFAGIVSTVYYVGSFLSLDPLQMISLMLARVFLNNDTRALAIDFGSGSQNISLFRESFRSVATLFGNPPANPALGQYLYAQAFHTSGYVGGNTSSTALVIAYGGAVEKAVFSLLLCAVAVSICRLARIRGNYSIIRLAIGLELLAYLSQDFLAFQVIVNILLIAAVCAIFAIFVRRLLLAASIPTSVL